jgi:predicted 3-demethylubiquinone-9 3-methyltransferase (glyoxalase superfamily)
MPKITPFLWFDGQAEEAANFYASVFPNSKILSVSRYGEGAPAPAGSVMTVAFELDGKPFVALNGGPIFKFNEAVSFVVECKDQAEIDAYWDKLTAGGGQPSQCGWLKDRYGLSWQVVPANLGELFSGPAEKVNRVTAALMQMTKLDVGELERAAA